MKNIKLKTFIAECKQRNLNCSITYQSMNDISIEIYTGYVDSYKSVFYVDGCIKLKKAINKANKFLLTYNI